MPQRVPSIFLLVLLVSLLAACHQKEDIPPTPAAAAYTLARIIALPTAHVRLDTTLTTTSLRVIAGRNYYPYSGQPPREYLSIQLIATQRNDSLRIFLPIDQLTSTWVGSYNFQDLGGCQTCPVYFSYHYRQPFYPQMTVTFADQVILSPNASGTLTITAYDTYHHAISGYFSYNRDNSVDSFLPWAPHTSTFYPIQISMKGTFSNVLLTP